MATRVSQDILEVLTAGTAGGAMVRVSQDIVEALIPTITRSPTTPTGAGVTQDVIEVLCGPTAGGPRVTQHVLEALVLFDNATGSGGGGFRGPTTFGYSV